MTLDNFDLSNWVYLQRRNRDKLSEEQIAKLDSLEMIWEKTSERRKVIEVIQANDIDYKKNKNVLKGITLFELKAKIRYLQKNGINIVFEDELNKIFFASDEELFNMIGMNKHELLLKYLTRKDKESYIKSLQK